MTLTDDKIKKITDKMEQKHDTYKTMRLLYPEEMGLLFEMLEVMQQANEEAFAGYDEIQKKLASLEKSIQYEYNQMQGGLDLLKRRVNE